ncbi:MAG: urease accessory protein UreF [Pseudonocardiaceae bacterium]
MKIASLLLADSRLPTGGHAHSGGVEAAIARGLLRDEADLVLFLAGRVRGSAPVFAAIAAAGCLLAAESLPAVLPPVDSGPADLGPADWGRWDAAVSARLPLAAAREASRAQGAALLRTARRVWPSAPLDALSATSRPHHSLVLGAAAAASGGDAHDAASLAVHHLLGGICSAAVRLLGLDPIAVAGVQAQAYCPAEQALPSAVRVAGDAVARTDTALLPSTGTPLPELLAELHARTEVSLFAS